MKSHGMKHAPMKEASSRVSTLPQSSHGKMSSRTARKGGPALSSTTRMKKGPALPKRESRFESSKPTTPRKASAEKRVVWSKTHTDREHVNDNRRGDAKPILKSAAAKNNRTASMRQPTDGKVETHRVEENGSDPSSPNDEVTNNTKLGQHRRLFSLFKKKQSEDASDKASWQEFIEILPASDGMNDGRDDNAQESRNGYVHCCC